MNLEVADGKVVGVGNEAHEGRDHIVRHCDGVVECPENLYIRGLQADLLLSLPKGSPQEAGIRGVAASTGEGDLALVMVDGVGTLGKDQVGFAVGLKERHEHSGAPKVRLL